MSQCSALTENLPLLLTESLDPARRELTHQHIETCAACSAEWDAYRETWSLLSELPEVEVPSRVKARFLAAAGVSATSAAAPSNVMPFHRRKSIQWLAQAAAVVVIAGGSYFAGSSRTAEPLVQQRAETPAQITGVSMNGGEGRGSILPVSLAETRVLDAGSLSPEIQGRPNIANVQFVDSDASDDKIGVAFDVTSRWTVTGSPRDKSMVRLLSYMIENEGETMPRSGAIEWVRRAYADPQNADPEISNALAKILRNDSQHEGVRLRAVDTLTALPGGGSSETREALIQALRSDPNPAVRIKAVEALANLARNGDPLDTAAVDMLRQKASQQDENVYVRVKAAEALSNIK
jgi:hypothetical protein